MKFLKLLCAAFLLMFIPLSSRAEVLPDVVYAVTPEHISAENISVNDEIDLYVIKTGKLSEELGLENGDKIKVTVLSSVKPKKGRRNGYLKIRYTGKEVMFGKLKMSEQKDVKDIVLAAGGTIAGLVFQIPGLHQAAAVSKGIIAPNENQTRIESAGKNLYESTPLKYAETGREFDAPENSIVILILK